MIVGEPVVAGEILRGLTSDELRRMAARKERTTEYGSASYITRIRSRSAKFTEIALEGLTAEQNKTIEAVRQHLKGRSLISVDRTMCLEPRSRLACRLYVVREFARLPYMWGSTLFPPLEGREPDLLVIDLPDWEERKMIVIPQEGVTYLLGSDYMGEIKKAFLRMAMYEAKKRGWLGFHAGSKVIRVRDVRGQLVERGAIFFGLSGTGKTTLTCHHHWLEGEEGVAIRQDDVVLMRPDASCLGTEDNFYIKTEGLEPAGQPILYEAAISPHAILENIMVHEDGSVDFLDYTLTSNGRCVILRSELAYTDEEIDLPRADLVFFITRRKEIVPPVARLTPEQGAAFFMLGESIETSAGDPSRAGQSLRVVGTNPFIVGPEYEEGNRFLEFLRRNPDVRCFALNTGRVGGEEGEKIRIEDTTEIIKQAARGGIEWKVDPDWGYEVPIEVERVEIERFDPSRFYTPREYEALVKRLRGERKAWLSRFEGLKQEIVAAIP